MIARYGSQALRSGRRPANPCWSARCSVLLVEQNVELALDIADRAYVLDQGAVVYHVAASELPADNEIKERCCSV
jgi:ABC-type branched-subunit amino acid transport system ATPase component